MKTTTIISGAFTAKGNFSGYTVLGERIHVSAQQMASLGLTADTEVKFPLYCVSTEREFNTLGTDGQPTEDKFTRTQAGSIFLTKEALITAVNSDRSLDIAIAQDLATTAKSAGLTEAQVATLLTASVF